MVLDFIFSMNSPENKAREEIDKLLKKAGWKIQHFKNASIHASKGVAVEYFQMGKGVGEADYVLFVNGVAVGIIEAKKEGETLIGKETQSGRYAKGFPEEFESVDLPLPFVYESTGTETRFTNLWDPKPRSREVFAFHKPETLELWIKDTMNTLRYRLTNLPTYENKKLWEVQKQALTNLQLSLAGAKPRALIQMATGSGKTFAAVNICYQLIKNANAKRILFLVDRDNLGKQTMQEFETFIAPKDGRKFTELYNVQHLKSRSISESSRVCISTIQRVYSMLKGEKLDPALENKSQFEDDYSFEPVPVEYNQKIPLETFDFIIVDECHRSIYKLWKQVLDYFDCFLIGLTATPSKSTIGFFDNNLVMEYTHEQAVADNVNVDFTVYNIRTKITKKGSTIEAGETIQKRDMRTRKKRWETLEDEVTYEAKELDRAVVAKDQIRTIIRGFKDKVLTEIFPGRKYVPKTLIYAKDDNHAEEIVNIIREEFNEGNDFAVKITYKTEGEKPEDLISSFRNEFNPRIAVTVDMIATGTDIKPLEIVFFMRSVKSRNYFEQMKGRGVRVMKEQDFKLVTPDGNVKERFVIIDAVGVTDNEDLNETRPLEQKPGVSFEKLLKAIRFGKPKQENLSSMASRLSRLQKKLNEKQTEELEKITNGKGLAHYTKEFVLAIDPDKAFEQAKKEGIKSPTKKDVEEVSRKRMIESIKEFTSNSKLMERLPEIKQEVEQILDDVSLDEIEEANYSPMAKEKAKNTIKSFRKFIETNKNELTAIKAFYNKGKLDWQDLKDLADKIKAPPYNLSAVNLWNAYEQIETKKVHGRSRGKIVDLIALLRFELAKQENLEPFEKTIDKRFSDWVTKQRNKGTQFTPEQLEWLEKIKKHITDSITITPEDFEYTPFDQLGGLGKANQIFENKLDKILLEMNKLSA